MNRLRLQNALNAADQAAWSHHHVEISAQVCRGYGVLAEQMVSRAIRDSFLLARITSMVRVFIPCRGGYSDRPEAYAAPDHITIGEHVLPATPDKLASE